MNIGSIPAATMETMMNEKQDNQGNRNRTMSKTTTLKGEHEGTMLGCLEWQAEMQGAMPELGLFVST